MSDGREGLVWLSFTHIHIHHSHDPSPVKSLPYHIRHVTKGRTLR